MSELEVMQEIVLELDGEAPFDYVVVKEEDKNARKIAVILLLNKQPYTIPAGTTARIKYYKPDGNEVLNDCTIEDGKVIVTYTPQMLAVSGTGKGEIVLSKSDSELKSATFYTKIVPAVFKTDGVISDKEFLSMAKVLSDIEKASDKAEENAMIAQTAASTADAATQNANNAIENAQNATAAASTATNNANAATQNANLAASAASTAAVKAQSAAAACEGIAAGINVLTDEETQTNYTLGVSAGILFIEERE